MECEHSPSPSEPQGVSALVCLSVQEHLMPKGCGCPSLAWATQPNVLWPEGMLPWPPGQCPAQPTTHTS